MDFKCCIGLTVLLLREKCPYSEFFWSVFSHIRSEYGEILRISSYTVRMRGKYGPEKLRTRTLFTQCALGYLPDI